MHTESPKSKLEEDAVVVVKKPEEQRSQKSRGLQWSYRTVVVQHSFLSFQHIEQRSKRCPSGTSIWDVRSGQQLLHSRGFIGFQGVSRVFKGFRGVEGVEGVEGLEGA